MMVKLLTILVFLSLGFFTISTAQAVSLVQEPKTVPIIIQYREAVSGAVKTERFLWDSERFDVEQFWPVTEVSRGRDSKWSMNRLLPTELTANDPQGIKIMRVAGEKDLWQVSARRVRFRFSAFGIESPDQRQGDVADRQTHEAEDLGLADILAEEDAKAGVEKPKVILRSAIALPGARLELAQIDHMILTYPKGWDGKVRGRYLRYHQNWKGTGKVQPIAGTFMGSSGDDTAAGAEFLPDGSIVALVNMGDPSTLESYGIDRLVADPPKDQQTEIVVKSGKRERTIKLEQRAPVLLHFDENLESLSKVVQFPLRTATGIGLEVGSDGSVSATMHIRPGPGKDALLKQLRVKEINREGREDDQFGTLLVHFDQALNVKWSYYFSGRRNVVVHRLMDGRLRITAGLSTWWANESGALTPGPELKNGRGGNMAVSPVDGSIVATGYFNNSTGREPWKRPYWHRWDADGKLLMHLYAWPGPLVGLDHSRQVSDALNYRGDFDSQGNYMLYAGHDGGNVVAANVPYDLFRYHNKYGALRDMSAASLGRYTSLLRINMETYDVIGASYVIGYNPILDYPSSGRINNAVDLADNRVAVAGSTTFGLIETADAWYGSFLKQRADPNRKELFVRGGSNFLLLSPDMKKMIFSSVIPTKGNYRVAASGDKVLLSATVQEEMSVYGDYLKPITKNPIQPGFAGGETDAWLLLIDTKGAQ